MRRFTKRPAPRGQMLPSLGLTAALAAGLSGFMLAYSSEIQMQVRAQSAADAAATAMVALQSNKFNQLETMLYGAALDEFRVRRTFDAALLALHRSGGCDPYPSGDNSETDVNITNKQSPNSSLCVSLYSDLRPRLATFVARYQQDASQLNTYLTSNSYSTTQTQATALLAAIASNCTPAASTACKFKYTAIPTSGNVLVPITPANSFVHDAYFARFQQVQPGPGVNTGYSSSFSPVSAEVVACQQVPMFSGIPLLGQVIPGPTFTVVGRASARTIPAVQEWFSPGTQGPVDALNFTQLSGIGLQPYEPASGADKLATDAAKTWWAVPNSWTSWAGNNESVSVVNSQNFLTTFTGFPTWNNPNANNGNGGYTRNYATGSWLPEGLADPGYIRYAFMPFSNYTAFVTWWSTAVQPISGKKLTQGTDYQC